MRNNIFLSYLLSGLLIVGCSPQVIVVTATQTPSRIPTVTRTVTNTPIPITPSAMPSLTPTSIPTTNIVVAIRDILPGEQISADDLSLIPYPDQYAPVGSFSEIEAVENQFAHTPIYTNEIIFSWILTDDPESIRDASLISIPFATRDIVAGETITEDDFYSGWFALRDFEATGLQRDEIIEIKFDSAIASQDIDAYHPITRNHVIEDELVESDIYASPVPFPENITLSPEEDWIPVVISLLIPSQFRISAEKLFVINLPPEIVPESAFESPEDIINARTIVDIDNGQIITARQLIMNPDGTPGMDIIIAQFTNRDLNIGEEVSIDDFYAAIVNVDDLPSEWSQEIFRVDYGRRIPSMTRDIPIYTPIFVSDLPDDE